uniref:C3H1-type domain-containing protein n=2 Tax=Timema TaxID=61471 RepID=A0A7R9CWV8_TIMPO|nr:unnamed protein product [Timema douglasi]CAD7403036.1 unnamed protein product [Timema poppensis]
MLVALHDLHWFGFGHRKAPATVPQNAPYVVYTDEQGQLLDTLPVCQDFNRQLCNRAACKFVHLQEGHVEVVDMKVVVCRDAVKGKCARPMCKYYHIPIRLPPANEMAQPEHSLRAAAGRMLCGI